jgi:hypothetical protein
MIEALQELRGEFVRLGELDASGPQKRSRLRVRLPLHHLALATSLAVITVVAGAVAIGAMDHSSNRGGGGRQARSAVGSIDRRHGGTASGLELAAKQGLTPSVSRGLGNNKWSATQPLANGRSVSLSSAKAHLPSGVRLAHTPLATNLLVIAAAYERTTTDVRLVITYRSGIAVEYSKSIAGNRVPWDYGSYLNAFRRVAPNPDTAFATSVSGHRALVINANTNATRTNPGTVEFRLSSVTVSVIGFRSTSSLLQVVESIMDGRAP